MPDNIGTARVFRGPNGPNNYISDNATIALTRDVNDRVILITLTTLQGVIMTKTITRDGAGNITAVGQWTR